jgi:rhamnosyltransferase
VNAAIRKDVWEATGFPEDLKIFEDVGIAKRILDAGWKIVYEPSATVYHSDNYTTVGLLKRYFDLGIVWNRLDIWDEATQSSLFRDGWRLLRRKLARGGDGENRGSRPFGAVIQDTAKYAGLLLGKNEQFLPLSIKRRISGARFFG